MKEYLKAALILTLALTTFERNALWRDDGSLWGDAVRKSPSKARGYNELGLHYVHLQDYPAALRAFSRSLELDRYQPVVYINTGLAYEGLGRFDLAIEAYERSIFILPNDPTPYYNLGHLHYTKLQEDEKALSYFLKAVELNPLEPDVHQYLGLLYQKRGDYARAKRELDLFRQLK